MPLKVSLVSVDRQVWEGRARRVIARTTEGDIGILPGHEPYLALLADGLLRVEASEGPPLFVAVHEGFFSVDSDDIKILAESAELGSEIDLDRAQAARQRALDAGAGDSPEVVAALHRAETRIDAATRYQAAIRADQ